MTEEARVERFPTDGPVELDIDVLAGRIDVDLTDAAEVVVTVTPLADRESGSAEGGGVAEGLAGLLNWVGGQFGDIDGPGSAVRELTVDYTADQLRVQSARQLPLRLVPLHVVVAAPQRSTVRVRTAGAAVRVDGVPGGVDVVAGSGDLTLAAVTGETQLRTGVGAIAVGSSEGQLQARTGAGGVAVEEMRGTGTVTTGGGDVWVGELHGNLMVRTGHGDITVRCAAEGEVELASAAGDLRFGLPSGVLAELDLQGPRGLVRSEVDVQEERPEGSPAIRLRGRTMSGKVALIRAGR